MCYPREFACVCARVCEVGGCVCVCVCVCFVKEEEVVLINMITDILHSVSMYISFCVKRSELIISHVTDIAR